MPRALLLENIDPVAAELLGAAGFEVESLRGALDEADLTDALDGVDGRQEQRAQAPRGGVRGRGSRRRGRPTGSRRRRSGPRGTATGRSG